MQRSEVNNYLQHTREFFRQQDVHLPPWADYSVSQWRAQDRDVIQEILALRLSWDLTIFGAADFMQTGLTQFTLRNGSPGGQPWHKPYAEKIMHVREGQLTPMHYYPRMMEDIVNRGGSRAHYQRQLRGDAGNVSRVGGLHQFQGGAEHALRRGVAGTG